jgi:hypothetical protein
MKRVSRWAIEIAPHDITYVNRTAIKSQVLFRLLGRLDTVANTGSTRYVWILDDVF